MQLDPYLFFRGNAKEAMQFYQGVFGGELTMQKIGEAPPEAQMPGSNPDDLMHAKLSGGAVTLMASDSQQASEKMAKVELSISGNEEILLRDMFNKLAEGGKVRMPLEKQFWGDTFGALTDKYGVDWMFNVTAAS
jgi:PhnB protein